jgi:hypothetical protein
MNAQIFNPASKRRWKQEHSHRSSRSGQFQTEDGFLCKHCNNFVPSISILSGVQNRNHCPYCLWSRHLDLFTAGDRLSACKSPMNPIGLTLKATWKKYNPCRGELMLIHMCTECNSLSINRIAADDDPQTVLIVYKASLWMDASTRSRLDDGNIHALGVTDRNMVCLNLFGQEAESVEQLFNSSSVRLE